MPPWVKAVTVGSTSEPGGPVDASYSDDVGLADGVSADLTPGGGGGFGANFGATFGG